jgi:polyhydroxybutyrate depolymerase
MDGISYSIPKPSRPMPILILHGKLDQNIPYEGGIGTAAQIMNRTDMSVASAVAFWTANNGCSGMPVSKRAGSVVVDSYSGCRNDADVMLYTLEKGRHAWAGGRVPVLTADTPDYELSAGEVVWSFLEAHPHVEAAGRRASGISALDRARRNYQCCEFQKRIDSSR